MVLVQVRPHPHYAITLGRLLILPLEATVLPADSADWSDSVLMAESRVPATIFRIFGL